MENKIWEVGWRRGWEVGVGVYYCCCSVLEKYVSPRENMCSVGFYPQAIYWAIQAGLLTPLTFARHGQVPWLLLLPVRTFFTMEGGDSEFANFKLPTLKAFLEARSHIVSGNKQ